jgi:beta-mannosidase
MNGNQVLPLDGDDWQIYPLLPEEWRWRGVWRDDPPAAAWRRIPARVPGHAQSALLAAGLLPHPYQGLNSYLWEWTSARDWIYQRTFAPPVEWSGRRLWLHFEGVDGAAHVFVNGQEAGRHDESFLPAEFEVSGLVEPGAENRLCVVVERAPDLQ